MGFLSDFIGGAVDTVGSILGFKSEEEAASTGAAATTDAAKQALALQKEMYYKTREDLAPWRSAGAGAIQGFSTGMGQYEQTLGDLTKQINVLQGLVQDPSSYTKSPGYNFLLNQGVEAVNRGSSAAGKLDSGENLKDLMTFGEGLASQDYQQALSNQNLLINNLLNRSTAYGNIPQMYAGMSAQGQNAAAQTGTAGQNYASGATQQYTNIGNALLNEAYNKSNARTGLYSNLAQTAANVLPFILA